MIRVVSLFLFLIIYIPGIAQAPKIEKYFEWFQKDHIIQTPVFANRSDEIAFAKRYMIRDSVKRTMPLEERITESLLPNIGASSRYNDPVIALLNTKTRNLLLIDYGWSPAFSPNDQLITYVRQQSPIQEKKIYASTLRGNDIRVFNKATKTSQLIVAAKNNFYLGPVFTDTLHIIYKNGDAVNGPFAGAISFTRINIKSKKEEPLAKSRIQYRLYDLMGDIYQIKNRTAYTVYSPRDSGIGMANEYAHLLLDGKDTLFDFGTRHYNNLEYKFALDSANQVIYLDDNHLMAEDTNYLAKYKNGVLVEKKPLSFDYVKAYLSPDGKKIIYINNALEIFVINTKNFQRTQLPLPKKEYHAVVWSADASKLAVIQDHSTIPNTDAMYLFKVE